MHKPNKKELRRELKELLIPVFTHIKTILDEKKGTNVLNIKHRGEDVQVQLHVQNNHLVVYIMYWYGIAPAFRVTPEQLEKTSSVTIAWLADEFVKINEHLITQVFKAKPTLH